MKEQFDMADINFVDQLKDAWRTKATKDLKGQSLSSIQLEVEDDMVLDPIYTREEVAAQPSIVWNPDSQGWKIVDVFIVNSAKDVTVINKQILESLNGGSEVMDILIHPELELEMTDLLDGVKLELVSIRLYADKGTATNAIRFKEQYARQYSIDDNAIAFKLYEDSIHKIKMEEGLDHSTVLANLIQGVDSFFTQSPLFKWNNLMIEWSIGSNILIEVSKIRALKLLLYAYGEKFNRPMTDFPTLRAYVTSTDIETELEVLIERGTKAFSAIVGGVDELYIDNHFHTAMEIKESDKKRVVRNIHWLLKLESQMEKLEDFSNGAYWIEECTRQLFEKAWLKYNVGGEG